jgi:Holliday junction resolvase
MRRAAKKDDNHNEIVRALISVGAVVVDLSGVGDGIPDILVGFRGQTLLLEIKDGNKSPSKRKLTEAQLKFHANWNGGPLAIVDSVESALRMIGVINGSRTI